MNETQEKVIQILVSHPPTELSLDASIHAVDGALGWPTKDTQAFVDDLEKRGFLIRKTEAINRAEDPNTRSRWWWERGEGTHSAGY